MLHFALLPLELRRSWGLTPRTDTQTSLLSSSSSQPLPLSITLLRKKESLHPNFCV